MLQLPIHFNQKQNGLSQKLILQVLQFFHLVLNVVIKVLVTIYSLSWRHMCQMDVGDVDGIVTCRCG